MIDLIEEFSKRKIKRFEKKMREMKPHLLNRWYEDQDERIRQEYEEEMDKRDATIYQLQRDLKEARNSRDYYKGKYEGVVEIQDKVQDKLINKIEKQGTTQGQLKQEVKQLKEEVASLEATDSDKSEE